MRSSSRACSAAAEATHSEPRPLFFAGVLDGGRRFRGEPGALLFAGAERDDRGFGLETPPLFFARLFRGGGGDRGEPRALFLAGALGGGRGVGGLTRPFVFALARFGDRRFGADAALFLGAGVLRGCGRGGAQPRAFLLAGVLGRGGRFGGDARALLFAGACGGGSGFRLDASAFLGARLFGGGGGGGLEPCALLFARALDGGGHRRFGLEQRAFLFAGALGGGRRLGAEAPDVFLALALERLRFRLGLLAPQRFVQRALRRCLRLDAQPLRFEPMLIRLAAQPLLALLGFAAQVLRALFGLEPQRVDLLALARRFFFERHHLQALGFRLRGELALPVGLGGAVVLAESRRGRRPSPSSWTSTRTATTTSIRVAPSAGRGSGRRSARTVRLRSAVVTAEARRASCRRRSPASPASGGELRGVTARWRAPRP